MNSMAGKPCQIGVVGERDAVLAFRALGMRVIPAETAQEAATAVQRLAREGVPVIFITEKAARAIPQMLDRYREDARIALIPIPGSGGSDGYGMERLRASVLRAVGADILPGNNSKER